MRVSQYFKILLSVLIIVFLFIGCNKTVQLPPSGSVWGGTSIPPAEPTPIQPNQPVLPDTSTPKISSLTPNSGPIGTKVTITGSDFAAGATVVTFNGVAALPIDMELWTNSHIVVSVPDSATTGNVVVTVNNKPSNGINFTVTPSATIYSLSPIHGIVGTSVTITGANFGVVQNTSFVTFNGIQANITSWSNSQIVAIVPNNATSGNVVVTVDGVPSNGMRFEVDPIINSVAPATGKAGDVITILGSGFGNTKGLSIVTFNGVAAIDYLTWTNNYILVKVPTNAPLGTGQVVAIINGVSSICSGVCYFTVIP